MLTGRNHHSNAMSCITEGSTGYPGGNGAIPFENGFLSEMLLQQGYATYCVGKWHLTPAEQISAAGPYDRWPLGRGFERYYGFLGGDTHQYYPDLVYDNHQVEPPKTPEEGYHLTADLADKAIGFIADLKQVAPDKPFFLYFAPGANHAPHHVPKEWADKYKGKFDDGWDVYREKVFARQKELGIMPKDAKLSRHDPDVQDWTKLPADERKLYARMMEVFAGFCEHMDHHVGRLIDFLEHLGELDNTLIMLISDNGASSEGGPNRVGQREQVLQQRAGRPEAKSGGDRRTRRPEIFQPLRLGMDERRQHAVPALEARNLSRRRLRSVPRALAEGHQGEGKDLPSVRARDRHGPERARSARRSSRRRRSEASPNRRSKGSASRTSSTTRRRRVGTRRSISRCSPIGRSITTAGGRCVRFPVPRSRRAASFFGALTLTEDMLRELDAKHWELYNLAEDPTETNDLAASNRPKLIEMIALWYMEAGKYNVFPLDSRGTLRFADERPELTKDRKTYVYYPHTQMIPENVAAKLLNRVAQPDRRCRDPQGRRGGRADLPRRQRRRLHALREGQEAPLRPQLRRRRGIPCRIERRTCRQARSRFATNSRRPASPT